MDQRNAPDQPEDLYERIQVRKALAYCVIKDDRDRQRLTLPETPAAKRLSSKPPISTGRYSMTPSQTTPNAIRPMVIGTTPALLTVKTKVEYGLELEDLIIGGNFDKVNTGFRQLFASHDPYSGAKEVNLKCLCFGRPINAIEAFNTLAKNAPKLRMAVLEELLSLAIQYPLIQLRFPIFAMGSYCVDSTGNTLFPVLSAIGPKRILGCQRYSVDQKWPSCVRFLTV